MEKLQQTLSLGGGKSSYCDTKFSKAELPVVCSHFLQKWYISHLPVSISYICNNSSPRSHPTAIPKGSGRLNLIKQLLKEYYRNG